MQEMVKFDKKHEDVYGHTESAADIAVFFSYDTSKYYTSSGEETDFYCSEGFQTEEGIGNYTDSFQGAYGMLFRTGIPFDVVTELNCDNLSRYSVLVIPTGACLSEHTAEALRTFVKSGGTIIADSESSLYSETFEKQEDFILAELFGVSFKGYRSYHPHDYFTVEDAFQIIAEEEINSIPAPLTAIDITVQKDAEIIAKLCPSLPGRYAGRPEPPEFPFPIINR